MNSPVLQGEVFVLLRCCLFLFLLLSNSGCSLRQSDSGICPAARTGSTFEVLVVRYAWHTGFLLKRANLEQIAWAPLPQFPSAPYLEFSWGDETYFPLKENSTLAASRAALLPTGSVIHVVPFQSLSPILSAPNGVILQVAMDQHAYRSLAQFIEKSFQRNAKGHFVEVAKGHGAGAAFYKAHGSFHLFHTCNTWTAEALTAASCPITPFFAITSDAVVYRVGRFGTPVKRSPRNEPMPNLDSSTDSY